MSDHEYVFAYTHTQSPLALSPRRLRGRKKREVTAMTESLYFNQLQFVTAEMVERNALEMKEVC